jgi:hypothetical protein
MSVDDLIAFEERADELGASPRRSRAPRPPLSAFFFQTPPSISSRSTRLFRIHPA